MQKLDIGIIHQLNFSLNVAHHLVVNSLGLFALLVERIKSFSERRVSFLKPPIFFVCRLTVRWKSCESSAKKLLHSFLARVFGPQFLRVGDKAVYRSDLISERLQYFVFTCLALFQHGRLFHSLSISSKQTAHLGEPFLL